MTPEPDNELCLDCAKPEFSGLADPTLPPGEVVYEVCEGCGPCWVDRDGRKSRPATPQEINLMRMMFGGVV